MQNVKLEECQNDYCHPLENGFYKCWEGKRKSPGKCKFYRHEMAKIETNVYFDKIIKKEIVQILFTSDQGKQWNLQIFSENCNDKTFVHYLKNFVYFIEIKLNAPTS